MRLSGAIAMIMAAAMLAGCGSSPKTHYYTLAVVAPNEAATQLSAPIQVAAVHLPAALDRREMVRQTGANSVDISDQDRWEAPLGGLLRRVMSEDLAAALPKGMVVLPDAPAPPQTARLVITIAEFGPAADGRVTLAGSWTLLRGSAGKPIMRREITYAAREAAKDANAQAAAMSELWGEAAQDIAKSVAAMTG